MIPEEISIELQELEKWLDERGYQGGEIIYEWNKSEQDAALHVCEELAYIPKAEVNRVIRMLESNRKAA